MSCKKLSCLSCLVLSLTLAGTAWAESWWDGVTSSDWFEASNWTASDWGADNPEEVPSSKIVIRQHGGFDPIVEGTTTPGQFLDISWGGNLTINNGGHVQSNNFLFMGRSADGVGDNLLTINEGGKFSGGLTNSDRGARIGYHQKGMHTLQMNGGEFSVPGIMEVNIDAGSKGHIQLDGGVMNVGGLAIGNEGTIDLNGGTLIVTGDATAIIDGYVAAGKITSANGTVAAVRMDYNSTHPGMTTVLSAAMAITKATKPSPSDGTEDVPWDTMLSWKPGDNADNSIVYIGTNFDDVNDAAAGTAQDANSYDPDLLAFDTTYFWRVDATSKGDVWSFTVEPELLPVVAIAATASSQEQDMGAENTINGSGLGPDDAHSTEATDMWLSGADDPAPSIEYAFDRVYKLQELWVWNSNQVVEAFGFGSLGAKDVMIEYSIDGVEWMILENVPAFERATGTPDYTANTIVEFGGAMAQFVRITINAGHGASSPYGLSEVRFLYVPTFAREPKRADGDTSEGVSVVLSWRKGREAVSHEVYLGSDADGLLLVDTTDQNTYTTAPLDYDTVYYWQIVEVSEAGTPGRHASDLWSFPTPEYAIVDDMESYDDDCNRIFFVWKDDFGHNGSVDCGVPAYNGNGTGSIVGYAEAPFAERAVVHSGAQSLPLEYDNTTGSSEITLSLGGQDWTASGITTFVLHVYGDPANTGGRLYVKINNVEVPFTGSPNALFRPFWAPLTVDLGTAGVNAANVTTVAIGIEGPGKGMLYLDDLRLYAEAPEGQSQDPGTDNLVAYYALDNNTQDSSGNGNHGVAVGGPTYAAGVSGMAMAFDGLTQKVDLGHLDVIGSGLTLAAWVKPESYPYEYPRIMAKATGGSSNENWWMLNIMFGADKDGGAASRLRVRVKPQGKSTATLQADSSGVMVGEWTHAAATWDGQEIRLYHNLSLVGSMGKWGSAVAVDATVPAAIGLQPFNDQEGLTGPIDEVRIYNRALSEAELRYIAE